MLRPIRSSLVASFVLAALAFGPTSDASAAPSHKVSRVLIKKRAHTLQLFAADADGSEEIVASYKVAIGPGGSGPKRKEGDMTTPVGRYHVTAHQPSQYKTFLRLDYPTAADYRRFEHLKKVGDLPPTARIGGDIGIHGPPVALPAPVKATMKLVDWTAGCIALDEDEITEVARLVTDGTVVDIED